MSEPNVRPSSLTPLQRLTKEARIFLAQEAFSLGLWLGGRHLPPNVLRSLLALFETLKRA